MVIVGGTSGLGLSAAQACVAAGARVAVCGKEESVASAAAELGPSVLVQEGDAQDSETPIRLIHACQAAFGRFDALYHVAGGSGRAMGDGPLHQVTDEGWIGTITLNQTSAFYSARAACRAMLERQAGGSIVLVGSVLADSPSPGFFTTHAYAAAKAALVGLAKAGAAAYAKDGIRFNVIAPGLVETPMARRAATDAKILDFIRTKQPLDGGRIGRPQDLDAAVVWLLSDGSRFVTGQTIAVDGGWSVSDGQVREDA